MASPVIFNGSDAKLLTSRDLLDSSGNAFAKGQEKSYTTAACRASKWAASGAGITIVDDTTTADLPRATTSPIGQKITGVSGSTAYAYFRFTLDPADYNTKLKVQFAMNPLSGYVASDFRVDVYSNTASAYNGTSTRLALATDLSSVSALPAVTGTYRTAFDAPGSAAPYIEIRIGLNGTNTHAIVISDLIVGPGPSVQGAALSGWQTYTPTITSSGTAPAKGATPAVDSATWRRIGDSIEVFYQFQNANAGTAGTGVYLFSLPSGLTINTAALPSATEANGFSVLGTAQLSVGSGGTSSVNATVGYGTSTTVAVNYNSPVVAVSGGTTYDLSVANVRYTLRYVVPVNEYVGAGTVNVVQNDIVYYSATVTSGTNWATGGTVTGILGPSGSKGGANTVAGTVTQFNITPTYPISATASIWLEVSGDQKTWTKVGGGISTSGYSGIIEGLRNDGTNYIGASASLDIATNNSIILLFGKYACGSTSAWNGTWYWRVAVANAGQAIGFGAASSTSGLVSYENGVTYTSGLTWSTTPAAYTLRFYRVGKVVTVDIAFPTITPASGLLAISGFSADFKPAVSKFALLPLTNATNGIALVDVDADGHIYISSSAANANWSGSTSTNTLGVAVSFSYNLQ